MVAVIIGLKWQLLCNGLRRSTPQRVGLLLAGLYGLSVVIQGVVLLIHLRLEEPSDVARITIIIGGSALTLGWALVRLSRTASTRRSTRHGSPPWH